MSQMLNLLSLYAEFIACLIAASGFSLFIGWMLSRSSASKRLQIAQASWQESFQRLEDAATTDTENLEEQLQDLAIEIRTLKANERVSKEAFKKNEADLQKARATAIELNRQNAETQERLQRVIQRKEREIVDNKNGVISETDETQEIQESTPVFSKSAATISSVPSLVAHSDDLDDDFEATLPESILTGLDDPISESYDLAMNNADTIAFNPSDLLDATLQMSAEEFIHQRNKLALPIDSDIDDLIDDTADVSELFMDDMEESTVALDDDSLAFAKRPYPVSNVD